MRKLKTLCVFAILVVLTVLLAGCGANVSTTMTIDAKDAGFSGSRLMTLLINADDLSKVTGGIDALETIIKENIPEDLSYAVSNPSDTETQIAFTLEFTSLEDYKTKVGNLLAANADNTIVPEISYEKNDTVFKKSLKFEENFETIDLLKWYQNAIAEANIISESSSNWYERGSNELIVDGTTLNTYGNTFSYNDVDERYLDNCEVHTTMNADGTYDRTITFFASKYSLERLNEVNEDFAGYMKSVATKGITYATETNEDNGRTSYIYTITGASAKDLVTKTNAVLQTSDNVFSVAITPKKNAMGKAEITIQERLDGSYYMNPQYYSISSTIVAFPGFKLTENNANAYCNDNELSYYGKAGEEPFSLKGDWLVGYENVALNVKANSLDKFSVELAFTANEALSSEIQDIAFSALETASKDNADFSKDGNTATCVFSGTAEEVTAKINAFVSVYAPPAEDEFIDYGGVFLKELSTASKFTNGLYGTMNMDLTPVVGDAKIYISSEGGTTIANQLESDDAGNYAVGYVDLRFYAVNLNIVTLILTILFAILLLGGVVLAVIYREGIFLIIADIKAKTTKPAQVAVEEAPVVAQSQQEQVVTPAEVPQEVAPAEVPQEVAPIQCETEEEEEIL